MRAYVNEEPANEVVTVEAQYDELLRDHKKLTMTRDELRQRAMQLMQHECQRLRQEIDQLQSTVHHLQPVAPDMHSMIERAAKEAYR